MAAKGVLMPRALLYLPDELKLQITSYLDPKSLLAFVLATTPDATTTDASDEDRNEKDKIRRVFWQVLTKLIAKQEQEQEQKPVLLLVKLLLRDLEIEDASLTTQIKKFDEVRDLAQKATIIEFEPATPNGYKFNVISRTFTAHSGRVLLLLTPPAHLRFSLSTPHQSYLNYFGTPSKLRSLEFVYMPMTRLSKPNYFPLTPQRMMESIGDATHLKNVKFQKVKFYENVWTSVSSPHLLPMHVENVRLEDCLAAVHQLFRYIAPESVTLEDTNEISLYPPNRVGAVCTSLIQSNGSRVKNLTILSPMRYGFAGVSSLPSLAQFTVLESLTLDKHYLPGSDINCGGVNTNTTTVRLNSSNLHGETFLESLPASLQNLEVRSCNPNTGCIGDVELWIEKLLDKDSEALPVLRQLGVYCNERPDHPLRVETHRAMIESFSVKPTSTQTNIPEQKLCATQQELST